MTEASLSCTGMAFCGITSRVDGLILLVSFWITAVRHELRSLMLTNALFEMFIPTVELSRAPPHGQESRCGAHSVRASISTLALGIYTDVTLA